MGDKILHVHQSLLLAQPRAGGSGFSWTLASRLGHMLRTIEERYGPRDLSWTILGVEFCSDGPQLWFPGNRRNIVIQLDDDCLTDPVRAHFQLAHECIHLLSPHGTEEASVLEEGLAVHFQIEYVKQEFHVHKQPSLPNYIAAHADTATLLALDPDAIRKLRTSEPNLHRVTAEIIREHVPEAPRELADRLAMKFERRPTSDNLAANEQVE